MTSEVVDKSRFAKIIGRSPGRITQLIAEGKISGAALEGDGRSARINVTEAMRQLGLNLHPGQQLAQPRPIFAAPPPPETEPPPALRPSQSQAEKDQARYTAARADKAEYEAAAMRAQAQARAGTWVEARDAAAAFSRQLRQFVSEVDASLPVFAEALAADLGIESRAAVLILRRVWRDLRAKSAAAARDQAEALPAAIPEPVEDIAGA